MLRHLAPTDNWIRPFLLSSVLVCLGHAAAAQAQTTVTADGVNHSYPAQTSPVINAWSAADLAIEQQIAQFRPPTTPSRPSGSTGTTATRYTPPRRVSWPSGPQGSTATRTAESCTGSGNLSLTALAPLSHIGQTHSSHPTFAWFVPEQVSRPIEFNLYESTNGRKGARVYRYQGLSKPGLMQLTLPAGEAGLATGKSYIWQVAVLCNPNRPSSDLVIEAAIAKEALPTELNVAIATAKTPAAKAQLYAQSGFWYDALSQALSDNATPAVTLSLLESLSEIEQNSPDQPSQRHSYQLQRVLNHEQSRL